MKIFYILFFLSFGYQFSLAQEININDEFKQALLQYMPEIDLNSDKIISENEASLVTKISLMNANLIMIEGLSNFVNLQELMLTRNNLKEIKLKNLPKLEVVYCFYNQLTHIELDNLPSLTRLYVGSNELTELNINHIKSLEVLDCGHNNLTKLDISHLENLTFLGIVSNKIEFIDISHNSLLKTIQYNFNPMKIMDISNNPNLIFDGRFSWDQNIKLKATKAQKDAIKEDYKNELQNPPLEIEEMVIEE